MITRRVEVERVRVTVRISGGRRPPPYDSRKRRGTEVGSRASVVGSSVEDDEEGDSRMCGEEGRSFRG